MKTRSLIPSLFSYETDDFWTFPSFAVTTVRNKTTSDGSLRAESNKNGDYVLLLDLPGVKKENLDISVDPAGILTVVSQRDADEKKTQKWVLGTSYDLERSTAQLEDGVLTLTFPPKTGSGQVRKLTVR